MTVSNTHMTHSNVARTAIANQQSTWMVGACKGLGRSVRGRDTRTSDCVAKLLLLLLLLLELLLLLLLLL